MERPTQPGDIAREAIRRLASRRQPPTPENFSRAYAEVEGREPALADWPNTLRSLMRQWGSYQPGLTQTRKREMLERVINQAGDRALVHLAQVVRQLLRPTDSLARYGGEEFLILLPNTGLDEAIKVMQRVQRELTRQFFMHENQRVLITFSAGVVELAPGEDREGVIARADAAMYRAKVSGRNRVERG